MRNGFSCSRIHRSSCGFLNTSGRVHRHDEPAAHTKSVGQHESEQSAQDRLEVVAQVEVPHAVDLAKTRHQPTLQARKEVAVVHARMVSGHGVRWDTATHTTAQCLQQIAAGLAHSNSVTTGAWSQLAASYGGILV